MSGLRECGSWSELTRHMSLTLALNTGSSSNFDNFTDTSPIYLDSIVAFNAVRLLILHITYLTLDN